MTRRKTLSRRTFNTLLLASTALGVLPGLRTPMANAQETLRIGIIGSGQIGGAIGKQEVENATDYTTWNFGVGWAAFDKLALDLRYHDSDLNCVTFCGEKVVLTLKTTLP